MNMKKFLALVLSIAMLFAVAIPVFADGEDNDVNFGDLGNTVVEPDYGDINEDGIVNVSDFQLLSQYILDDTLVLPNKDNADVNGDGGINVSDFQLLSQYVLDSTVVLGPQ